MKNQATNTHNVHARLVLIESYTIAVDKVRLVAVPLGTRLESGHLEPDTFINPLLTIDECRFILIRGVGSPEKTTIRKTINPASEAH